MAARILIWTPRCTPADDHAVDKIIDRVARAMTTDEPSPTFTTRLLARLKTESR